MFLDVTTRIPVGELSVDEGQGLITKHSIEVWIVRDKREFEAAGLTVPVALADDDGDEELLKGKVGTASVDRLHLCLCERAGLPAYEVCDADSREWEATFAAFLNEDRGLGYYQERKELEDCCTGDVLLIHDISVETEYRDRGVELAIASRIIETLGAGCDLALYVFNPQTEELKRYESLGFRASWIEGFAFLNLLDPLPLVDEIKNDAGVLICRFQPESITE